MLDLAGYMHIPLQLARANTWLNIIMVGGSPIGRIVGGPRPAST